MIADGATAIHSGNLMTLHCAQLLESGRELEARTYSSMAKNHIARSLAKSQTMQFRCMVVSDTRMIYPLRNGTNLPRRSISGWAHEIHDMVISRDFMRERVNLLV